MAVRVPSSGFTLLCITHEIARGVQIGDVDTVEDAFKSRDFYTLGMSVRSAKLAAEEIVQELERCTTLKHAQIKISVG